MKKLMALVLAVLVMLGLIGCGTNNADTEQAITGTWKVDAIEYEGSKFTVEEWNTLEDEDLSEFYIILKDGGKAYIYDGYGDLVNWLKSDNTIMIDDEKGEIVDGLICFEYYGDKLYLKKVSDDQQIPEEPEDDEDAENEFTEEPVVTTTSTTIATTSTTDVTTMTTLAETEDASHAEGWREFLQDYEAWVDSYITFMEKYKANPTDLTLLSDYAKMMSEMSEWSLKADELELEIEDPEEALEYSAELLRIAGKLAEAVQ